MAKSIAELEGTLTPLIKTLTYRVDELREGQMAADASKEDAKERYHDLRRDLEKLNQRVDEHLKRVDKWEGRFWSLFLLIITLLVGLVIAVAKKWL